MIKAQEVIDAVSDINERYRVAGKNECCPLKAVCNGSQIRVTFFGINIWDLENDDREFLITKNDYENIKIHLLIRMREIQSSGIFKYHPGFKKGIKKND